MTMIYRNGYLTVKEKGNNLILSYERTINKFEKTYCNISRDNAIKKFKKEIDCLGY